LYKSKFSDIYGKMRKKKDTYRSINMKTHTRTHISLEYIYIYVGICRHLFAIYISIYTYEYMYLWKNIDIYTVVYKC